MSDELPNKSMAQWKREKRAIDSRWANQKQVEEDARKRRRITPSRYVADVYKTNYDAINWGRGAG